MVDETVENFKNTYLLLTPLQRTIWGYLKTFAQHKRLVFPSQTTIAKACGCTREYVCKTLRRFKDWGWMSAIRRAYKSCVYLLPEGLVKINHRDPKTYDAQQQKSAISPGRVHNSDHSKDLKELKMERSDVQPKSAEKFKTFHKPKDSDYPIKPSLMNLPLLTRDKQLLSRYPDAAVACALEDYEGRLKYRKAGPIQKLAAWLENGCQRAMARMGLGREVRTC